MSAGSVQTKTEWFEFSPKMEALGSLLAGVFIALGLDFLLLSIATQGIDTLVYEAEIAGILAGLGITLGYQTGASLRRSTKSFTFSMGFGGTIIATLLYMVWNQFQQSTFFYVGLFGFLYAGFLFLVLFADVSKRKALDNALKKWSARLTYGLAGTHVAMVYLVPTIDTVLTQWEEGTLEPNIAIIAVALIVVVSLLAYKLLGGSEE